jgi:putative transposase
MTPPHLKNLITAKAAWAEPLSEAERCQGFKGWYIAGRLPHRDLPGILQFVTFRLADSLPPPLPPPLRRPPRDHSSHTPDTSLTDDDFDSHLDRGLGRCDLRRPEIASLVEECLWYHDGIRYRLHGWVIMPNHVHVLVEVWDKPLFRIVQSWKGYTATQCHRILERTGTFWQRDYFDRYIRDTEHYQGTVRYIEDNPVKAGLVRQAAEWPWSSARFRGAPGPEVPVLTHPTATRRSDECYSPPASHGD